MVLHETNMLYKLIILYTLNRVDFPLSNNQITEFLLEKEYTNYFVIQQSIGELIDDNYVYKETHYSETRYTISEIGQEVLKLLKKELSQALRDDIDEYINANSYRMRDTISVTADYYKESNESFRTRLLINENGVSLISLELAVSSKEEAETICGNWKVQSSILYPGIIKSLLKIEPAE